MTTNLLFLSSSGMGKEKAQRPLKALTLELWLFGWEEFLKVARKGDILVMDNLKVHKCRPALKKLQDHGVNVLFIPPYAAIYISPCDNNYFGQLTTLWNSMCCQVEEADVFDRVASILKDLPCDNCFRRCQYPLNAVSKNDAPKFTVDQIEAMFHVTTNKQDLDETPEPCAEQRSTQPILDQKDEVSVSSDDEGYYSLPEEESSQMLELSEEQATNRIEEIRENVSGYLQQKGGIENFHLMDAIQACNQKYQLEANYQYWPVGTGNEDPDTARELLEAAKIQWSERLAAFRSSGKPYLLLTIRDTSRLL
jgi:hypothetical protein